MAASSVRVNRKKAGGSKVKGELRRNRVRTGIRKSPGKSEMGGADGDQIHKSMCVAPT